MTLYARFAAHLDAVLDALEAEGALRARRRPRRGRGRAAARSGAWRSRHQRGDGAGQARRHQSARAGRGDRAEARRRSTRWRAPRWPGRASSTSGSTARSGRRSCARSSPRATAYGRSDDGRGAGRSTSNMSRPTRPGRCTWAIAAARWSATRSPALLEYAGHKVIREYYVNDAGAQVDVLARSAHLRYREALGRQIGEIPEGLYPGDYLKPVGEALAAEFGDALCRRARERMAGDLPPPDGRGDDRADQGRSRRCSASITICSPPRRRCRRRARSTARSRWLDEKGLVYEGALPPPKGKTRRGLGAGRAAPVPLDRSSATTRTGRSGSRTAAGPISPPTPPITCRSSKRPTS